MKPGDRITSDEDHAALPDGARYRGRVNGTSTYLVGRNRQRVPSVISKDGLGFDTLVSLPSFNHLTDAPLGLYVDNDGDVWEVRADEPSFRYRCDGDWLAWQNWNPKDFTSAPFRYVSPLAGWPSERSGTPRADAVTEAHRERLLGGFYKTATGRGLHKDGEHVRLWTEPRSDQPHWGDWMPMSEVPADDLPLTEAEHPNACPKCSSTDRVAFRGTIMPPRIVMHHCNACLYQEKIEPAKFHTGGIVGPFADLRTAPNGFYELTTPHPAGKYVEWNRHEWAYRYWGGDEWTGRVAWSGAFNDRFGPFTPCADPSLVVDEPTDAKLRLARLDEISGDFGGRPYGCTPVNLTPESVAAAEAVLEAEDARHNALTVERRKRRDRDAAVDARIPVDVPVMVFVPVGLLEALEEVKHYGEGRVSVRWQAWRNTVRLEIHIESHDKGRSTTSMFTLGRDMVGTGLEATPENIRQRVRDAIAEHGR